MGAVGRYLTIFIVVLLVIAVWAILVAPDYDLDPTVLSGKQAIHWNVFPAILLSALLACVLLLERIAAGGRAPRLFFLSLLELTCARLC